MYINEKSIFWESFSELDKLYEAAQLNEDIAAVKKNFPSIDDDTFMELISLDPTYKDDRDSVGNYGKWILNLFNKNKLKQDEFDSVTDALTDFEEKKKWLANKDIGQFKSLDELQTALENVEVGEVSHARQVKDVRKAARNTNLDQNTAIVFEDNDWIVYVPKTYAASCKLGQNTSWCTATKESDEYYKQYTSTGPLYIIINKHNNQEKYQLHFETDSYMDADDEAIDTNRTFYKYPELLEAIKNRFQKDSDIYVITKKDQAKKKLIIPNGYTGIRLADNTGASHTVSIEIPGSVKRIDSDIITKLYDLESIILHEGVEVIQYFGFACLNELVSISFPKSLKIIGAEAFAWDPSLEEVNLQEGVQTIGSEAFTRCLKLKKVTLPASLTTLGNNIFKSCPKLQDIYYGGTRNAWNDLIKDTLNPKLTKNNLVRIHCKDDKEEEETSVAFKKYFKLSDDGKTISAYTGQDYNISHLVIPEGVENLDIYEYRNELISDTITSIVVPKSFKNFYDDCVRLPNLKYILYEGSKADWRDVFVSDMNEGLEEAVIIFNWNEEENKHLFD